MTDVLTDPAVASAGQPDTIAAVEDTVPVLELRKLSVSYLDRHRKHRRVVHEVSLKISPGEVLALVGESGSGKSTTAQAVIGLLAGNGRLEKGSSILLNGTDIASWSQKRLESIRGAKIALIPQDPTSSLNPVRTVGAQVEDVLRLHTKLSKPERRRRVLQLLERVGIPEPERRAGQYAHELSGGMKQRVLIAAAIALEPQLIIADEATSALDVSVQRRILDLIDDLRTESGTAVLFVTHDLAVAADRADRVVVLKDGRVQEQGSTTQVLTNPATDYTRQLLADAPSISPVVPRPAPTPGRAITVQVSKLVQEFETGRNQRFRAVDGVSFQVPQGSTHAIVGESGSGKTTTARALAGFQRPTSGSISIGGRELSGLDAKGLREFRRHVQLVYQNPFTSLDPRQTVARIIEEPLLNFGPVSRSDRGKAVRELLQRVHLPEHLLSRHPRELSGGQRQRVAIARALVLRPQVLILDEAVSALDVTVQSQILSLLEELQGELDLSYVFITHDLAVVRQIADTVSVMSAGRQVETGTVSEVFDNPQHHYTRELIEAIPGKRKAKQ